MSTAGLDSKYHLASTPPGAFLGWTDMTPQDGSWGHVNNITGGKRYSGRTTKGDVRLWRPPGRARWAAARRVTSYFCAHFWRLAERIGKNKAAIAMGHSIWVARHVLRNDYDRDDYFVTREADKAR